MTALAFKVNVRYIITVKESVKLPVILKQKVLCTTRHIFLRYFPILLRKPLYKNFRIVIACDNFVKVSETFMIIIIIGNTIVLSRFHSGYFVYNKCR